MDDKSLEWDIFNTILIRVSFEFEELLNEKSTKRTL